MSEKINGTDLSNAELSFLCIALRCDVPYLDVAAPLVKSGLLEPLRDDVYQISEDGRNYLVEVLEDLFVKNFKMLHSSLGFMIDHIYVGRGRYDNYVPILRMVFNDLPKVADAVNAEMCRVGSALKAERRKPWMTLKDLNALDYYVDRKTEHFVSWRYGWVELKNLSDRERRYKGRK
jgi:hypothetical protein